MGAVAGIPRLQPEFCCHRQNFSQSGMIFSDNQKGVANFFLRGRVVKAVALDHKGPGFNPLWFSLDFLLGFPFPSLSSPIKNGSVITCNREYKKWLHSSLTRI